MKIATVFLLFFTVTAYCQETDSFDIARFTPPEGWQQINKDEDGIGFSRTNNEKRTYSQIAMYKSIKSLGTVEEDFKNEWDNLVGNVFMIKERPMTSEVMVIDDWKSVSGFSPFTFNGEQFMSMLVTMSGFGRTMSIIVITNTQEFKDDIQKFLESVTLVPPGSDSNSPWVRKNTTPQFLGTWVKSAGMALNNNIPGTGGLSGWKQDQYTFNEDGSYVFYSKIITTDPDIIIFVRENGKIKLKGNIISLTPAESFTETWSRKRGSEKPENLVSMEMREPEPGLYMFTRYFDEISGEWFLVLQSDEPTLRDGPFSVNTTFSKSWYYSPISEKYPKIELPEIPSN